MPPKEKVVVVGLGALTLGTTAVSALAGSAESSLCACAALLFFLFICGYVLIRSRHQAPPAVPVQEAEQDETVWPPAPKQQ